MRMMTMTMISTVNIQMIIKLKKAGIKEYKDADLTAMRKKYKKEVASLFFRVLFRF